MTCTILLSTADHVVGVQVVLLVVITIIAMLSTLIITFFLIGIGVRAVINVSCLILLIPKALLPSASLHV